MASFTVTLEEKIKAEAFRLGFSLCGITIPRPLTHFEIFEDWVKRGDHAGMRYLETARHMETRKNPASLMPSARSILSLGWSFPLTTKKSFARVAGYVQTCDYHPFLIERMRSLREWIEVEIGRPVEAHAFTDSAPLLEREIGSLAGLGWVGRNGCLISPKVGSNFLLAELLLDVDLQTDAPFARDHCGTCELCLHACPTGCIQPDRTINANRCISYLTIEHRGAIPGGLREVIGDHLFGCDDCQTVCPWNKRSKPNDPATDVNDFSEEALSTLLKISPEDFNSRYKHSSLARAKWQGLVRNALIVIGNQGGRNWEDPLRSFLHTNSDPVLVETARWALGQLEKFPRL